VISDLAPELGGSGAHPTPGWLLRAGLASCAATRIAMGAATEGIEIEELEVIASSRSDARGVFAMEERDGSRIGAGPRDVRLEVRIAAPGVPAERLHALVRASVTCSPVSDALLREIPLDVRVEVVA
jgi:uncharacterized OsmC-like protein